MSGCTITLASIGQKKGACIEMLARNPISCNSNQAECQTTNHSKQNSYKHIPFIMPPIVGKMGVEWRKKRTDLHKIWAKTKTSRHVGRFFTKAFIFVQN